MKLYDSRFDLLELEYADISIFKRKQAFDVLDANLKEDSYVTLEELQEEFSVSRYQIVEKLKKLGALPIGIKKNVLNGKRMRGVGKIVYDIGIIKLIYEDTPIEDIKEKARQLLKE